MGRPAVHIAPDVDRWANLVATHFGGLLGATVATTSRFSVALTGGSAAKKLYPVLARRPINWDGVTLFWGDERAVEPNHEDSNFNLANRTLLCEKSIAHHRMRGEAPDLDRAAAQYEQAINDGAGGILDLVFLGVGPDGHVCSLFADHPSRDATGLVTVVRNSPKPPPNRLSLTMTSLMRARALWFLVVGSSKRGVVQRVFERQTPATPDRFETVAGELTHKHPNTSWFMDRAAAQGVSELP